MIDPKLQELADKCLAKGKPEVRTVVTNVTDLHRGPSFLDELFMQICNGTKVEVLDEKDKWCFVREEGGYLGWAYAPYLASIDALPATHMIVYSTALYEKPESEGATLCHLMSTTPVRITERRERSAYVQPVGNVLRGGWVFELFLRDLNKLPFTTDKARADIVGQARIMTGIYYLWGGNTTFGTDCSGLAMLTHRLSGYTLPRDADMQFAAGKPVEEPFQPGDLLFFHNEARTKIGHVGISTGGWNMIHSSRSRNGVYEEDVQSVEHLRNSFAGARTFLK